MQQLLDHLTNSQIGYQGCGLAWLTLNLNGPNSHRPVPRYSVRRVWRASKGRASTCVVCMVCNAIQLLNFERVYHRLDSGIAYLNVVCLPSKRLVGDERIWTLSSGPL